MMNKDKNFDAVRMMREIRDRLHEEYQKDTDKRKIDLERIRRKFMKAPTSR